MLFTPSVQLVNNELKIPWNNEKQIIFKSDENIFNGTETILKMKNAYW